MEPLQYCSSGKDDWYEKGHELMGSKKYRQAVRAFDKAIDGSTASAQAYFFRGVCHYLIGNYHLAHNDMDAAAILGYRDAQFWSKFEMKGTIDKDHS